MNKCTERLYNGLVKENPTLVLMLGMCPTLAVTTSAINGLGMGLSTTAVLVMSNLMISALRKIIPDKVRMPAFIVIVASFVTIVELLVKGFLPSLNDSLGIYIPLIVVNCIILGRAEAYASKNPVLPSIFDGIGMGLGFTCSLTMIGLIREIIGAGTAFGAQILPDGYEPFSIFVMAPGAFFVLAILTAIQNKLKLKSATNGDAPKGAEVLACGGNCAECVGETCAKNRTILEQKRDEAEAKKADAKASAAKAFPENADPKAKEGGDKS
jgi:electron transport complex protein RnfE